MSKLHLNLCLMSAFVLILLGSSMRSLPLVNAQTDKDILEDPTESMELVLVRSRSSLGKDELGMLLGLTCPPFLSGRYSKHSQIAQLFCIYSENHMYCINN